MRVVALMGGGDWADASVTHLVVPDELDLEALKTEWRYWYNNIYCKNPEKNRKYRSFEDFIKERGGRPTTEKEVEEFWDE